MTDLPEYDETITCTNPECVYRQAKPVTGLHGIAGGGMGPYTCCEICGTILSKTQDAEILCDTHNIGNQENEPTEIKAPDVQAPPSDKS